MAAGIKRFRSSPNASIKTSPSVPVKCFLSQVYSADVECSVHLSASIFSPSTTCHGA